jgi:type II secretory pathway component PulF
MIGTGSNRRTEARMFSSPRLSLSDLIELCRVLRHYLSAGLVLVDVFRQQAAKGRAAVRPPAGRIAAALENGDSLEDALKPEAEVFPPLFLSLVRVGERTGMLPEVCGELEKFFTRQQRLKRQFISQITWPVIQFVLAVFVLAGLILVMGWLADRQGPGGKPFDPLGLGLLGPGGALIFLTVVWGTLGAAAGLLVWGRRTLRGREGVDAWLLRLPALGPCLRVLALSRFCLALGLTMETGMAVHRALRLALRATGNRAFEAASESAEATVKAGDELTLALTRCGLFPEDFLHILAVGEESGQIPEVLRRQATHYDEEAGRKLAVLAGLAGYGVWIMVGIFIIIAIFRIALSYINLLQ